ncbi:hypothetical protein INT46_003349 [Mucor plumbeus]|uniref:Uncharacterized protein n=1 Tax=Mucor plumbeus TaxID=97098 RepID=A0A8H7QRP9_9FUNG|nr:hypothetical protein INT46_003349 [Mucor plumbeus]
MHKRQLNNKNSKHTSLQDDNKIKKIKKHPVQQVISTLPQLAISFAILFFAGTQFQSGISNIGGAVFYISLLAGFIICSVFLLLQIQGAEYKNWQQDPTTRQYIQIASISTVVSFIGFNYSLWSVFGILTPMLIVCGFVFVCSLLVIIAAFV